MVCEMPLPAVTCAEDVCVDRQSCGTSLASLFARTTSTVWVHQQSVVPPTPSTLPAVTRFLVSRSVPLIGRPYHIVDVMTYTHRSTVWTSSHPNMPSSSLATGSSRVMAHSWWSSSPIATVVTRTRHRSVLSLWCYSRDFADRMSDPGTTYRTREEVQRMRSTQDPIRGLQRYIEEWGLATEQELKVRFYHLSSSNPH